MSKISSTEIKNRFLSFFKEKDHAQIKNSSIIPQNDPTLLFINSGMAPIKNYFTGTESPPYPRLCNVQPCIRTIDIESIGDKHHLTSFQMLGSWSINDYFKEKAIFLAFEFLTQRLNIPQEKLYVTVFAGDDDMGLSFDSDAYECWKKLGMPESHIVKCGKEDNFWGPTAETGPCGPCTEVFYDTGEGKEYIPDGEFDTKKRYIEIWNAGVFMQLNKNADGTFGKLDFTSVDTGAGLERLTMVLNGCPSVYETDLLAPIVDFIKCNIDVKGVLSSSDLLILTDHLKTLCLILSEKVGPSNEGRGYIPRKLIRRCMMKLACAKIQNYNLCDVSEFILGKYRDTFEKFEENRDYVLSKICEEQSRFKKVLENGIVKLEEIKIGNDSISGNTAFELATTYGLPFDIIKEFALENNLTLDEQEFKTLIEKHKNISRNSNEGAKDNDSARIWECFSGCSPTEFVGYESLECGARVIKIVKNGEEQSVAASGDIVFVAFDKTCLYAESGGQCADSGTAIGKSVTMSILDVKKTPSGVFVHKIQVEEGSFDLGELLTLNVDSSRRERIANNHTATHLLQSALQKKYGKNLHQAGSKVEDTKLRFDFNFDGTLTQDDIFEIEREVNLYVRKNLERKVEIKKLSQALSEGANAFFESKYGNEVRVVSYGDVSKELCGGTHTSRTGNVGMFAILSYEGIGKGIKRITAATGDYAIKRIQFKNSQISNIAKMLKTKEDDIEKKIEKEFQKQSNKKSAVPQDVSISEKEFNYITSESGVKCAYICKQETSKKLTELLIKFADKSQTVMLCVSGEDNKNITVIVADVFAERFFAKDILKNILERCGGKGGGNKKISNGCTQADSEKILAAFKSVV